MPQSALYEADFYAWANEQAALLRSGNFAAADIAHIAEEIESMGKTEKRELENRLTVLLLHLLKWKFQSGLRGNSWRLTIKEQRRRTIRHLKENPSLRARLEEIIDVAYGDALIEAERETGLPESIFPTTCPWSFAEITDDGFWP